MNKLSPDIPNLIKQPSKCCVYCGKSYKKKTNLEKHVVLCELLNKSKRDFDEDDEDIPSQRKMFRMLLELGNKFNKLEGKIDEINKWVIKKKKTINIVEWLNTNVKPEIKFDNLIEKIIITHDDVKYLFENSFIETMNEIFSKYIYTYKEENPLLAFVQKSNVFYIYENEHDKWIELGKDKLIKFLNKFHMKLLRTFSDYKRTYSDKIRDDERFSILCDKTSIKMMNIDFKQENILGKIKTNMYTRMKTDMKGLIEYEFEF